MDDFRDAKGTKRVTDSYIMREERRGRWIKGKVCVRVRGVGVGMGEGVGVEEIEEGR